MKYGHPTLVRHPLWVSLPSDEDIKFLLKPLSYGQVYGMNEYYYIKDKLDGIVNFIPYDILLNSIIDVKGTVGFNNTADILKALSTEDKSYLEYKLYQFSALTQEQLENIKQLIDLMTNETLQEPTYNCSKCKTIPGMQEARNCPLLANPPPFANFKLRINETTYTKCPVSDIDNYVSNQIIQSNNFLSFNILPVSGGIEEQSAWFVLVSQMYKSKLNELRANKTQL